MEKTGKLVLWGCATPRTLRVHWALHELGLDYRCEPIQPRASGDLNEAFAKLNPQQKVPVLQDNDFVLTESAAIVNYLYAAYGPPAMSMAAGDPGKRASYDAWCYFVMTELDATSLYVLRRHVGLAQIYGEAPAAVASAKAYFQRQIQKSCFVMAKPHDIQLADILIAYRDRAMARAAYAAALTANSPEAWRATG